MTLTLTVRNADRLDNGMPAEFVLHRRGALIGRAPTCDWCLPDPRKHISSRHCEVSFADGFYTLADTSLNGTFLNGSDDKMTGPRRIEEGDRFTIGRYEIVARLSEEGAAAIEREADAARRALEPGWRGWDGEGDAPAAPSAEPDRGWGPVQGPEAAPTHEPAAPLPRAEKWTPSMRAPDPLRASTWEPEPQRPDPASDWSSAAPDRPPPPSPDDIWGRLEEGHVVDWARGGFGQPIAPRHDPLRLGTDAQGDPIRPAQQPQQPQPLPLWPDAPAAADSDLDWVPPSPPASSAPSPPPEPIPVPAALIGAGLFDAFLEGAEIDRQSLRETPEETLDSAGQLLLRLVGGLMLMVAARTRAKEQMGAETTAFEFDGNNPIKFARSPEDALAKLLNPPLRGFIDAGRAVDEAFFDLQSHQVATLKAMQGALRATLDRFSPRAIRQRAEEGGLLAKILPHTAEAALWRAYEKEFGGVAQGSDEAFIDVFAREFRTAYEALAARQRRR